MKTIFGLGNPGNIYKFTRHNTGFMIVDKIREKYDFPDFEFNKKFNSEITSLHYPLLPPAGEGGSMPLSGRETDEGKNNENNKIVLVKPQTMMNDSGQTVRAVLDFYKLTPADIIVIHDDIDLALGKHKIATGSGSAGHNGVQNIMDMIGTKDFVRIRIGIANPDLRTKINPTDFVLQNFSEEEMKEMEKIVKTILEEIKKLITPSS